MTSRRTFHGRADGMVTHTHALVVCCVPEAERMRDRFLAKAGACVDGEPERSKRLTELAADLNQAIAEANALKACSVIALFDPRSDALVSLPVMGRIGAPAPMRNDYGTDLPADCEPQERA